MEGDSTHRTGHDEDRPAAPQQPGEGGFDEGLERRPDTAADESEPDFARGMDADDDGEVKPRFSRGEEEQPESAQNRAEGSFSEGLEQGSDRD